MKRQPRAAAVAAAGPPSLPHCGRVAGERRLDSLARQRLGLAREQRGGGKRRLVPGTPSATAKVARSAHFEGPPARAGSFSEMSSLIISLVQPEAHFEAARSVKA